MKKAILGIFFSTIFSLGFGQMKKESVEFELAKYVKNTCYRFSISTLNSPKSIDLLVEDNFEMKFGETVLTITNGERYLALPYQSILLIESSTVANKKEGKFTIYL